MDWKQRKKVKHCTCEHVRSNAFRRAFHIFKPRFESILTSPLVALNNEERKAVEAHRLEVERKRAAAIMQARYSICK